MAGQLAADHTNIIAAATAQKLMPPPDRGGGAEVLRREQEELRGDGAEPHPHRLRRRRGSGRATASRSSQRDALKKAQSIAQQAKGGADFAKLARENSDDAASADKGGVLGPFSPGMLPPEIESHVDAAPAGPGQRSRSVALRRPHLQGRRAHVAAARAAPAEHQPPRAAAGHARQGRADAQGREGRFRSEVFPRVREDAASATPAKKP